MTSRVAIVGCGKIADGHVEEIQKLPSLARIVGVCDREPLMAEQIAMRFGLPFHTHDYERLLAEQRPDVVHITTPPASHLALARQAIDAGCHVYVEKPLTLGLADTRALLAHADRSRKKLTIGYTYLFDPPAIELRALVAKGVIGEVVHVESFYGYNLSGPFGAAIIGDPTHWVRSLPGQLFHNNIDHVLNKLLEFIADDEPAIVARATTRGTIPDELRVLVSGDKTTAYATFSAHVRPVGHFVRVYGTRNTAHVDYVARTVTLEGGSSLPSAIGRLVPAFEMAAGHAKAGVRNLDRFARSDFQFFSGLNQLFRLFYTSIRDDTPPPISPRDILRMSWMLDEIFRQVR